MRHRYHTALVNPKGSCNPRSHKSPGAGRNKPFAYAHAIHFSCNRSTLLDRQHVVLQFRHCCLPMTQNTQAPHRARNQSCFECLLLLCLLRKRAHCVAFHDLGIKLDHQATCISCHHQPCIPSSIRNHSTQLRAQQDSAHTCPLKCS